MTCRKLLNFPVSAKGSLLAALVAFAFCLMITKPAFARPQDNDRPAVQPKVVLPLQIGFARGGTALYIARSPGRFLEAAPEIGGRHRTSQQPHTAENEKDALIPRCGMLVEQVKS